MLYRIVLKPKAEKQLDRLSQKYQRTCVSLLRSLAIDPFQGKKLEGDLKGLYSVRLWPYRILYKILKNELVIIIIDIGHRQGIYKK